MKTKINKLILPVIFLLTALGISTSTYSQGRNVCAYEQHIADGYYATIWSVVDNGDGTYTIQIKVWNDGSGGDKELSHASFEADAGTYSDVSVVDYSPNFGEEYEIDLGPNLGGDPFQGFKIDETSGFGNGVAGWFIVQYTLDAPFQDQYVLVKHGLNRDKKKFNPADFQQVLNCQGPSNDPPNAADDVNTTQVNTPVSGDVSTNDSDPNSDNLIYTTTPVTDPQHGSVVLNSDGTYTYTPDNGYVGTDTFVYEVCDDGTPSECDQATVTITIIEGPTANDDNASTNINTPVDINVLSNDVAGGAPLDPTSISFVSGTEPDPTTEGVFTVNGTTGLVTYTPATNYTGVVTIDYEVCDDNSLCDQATITVTITGGGTDTDGDGVDDGDDDYPDDPDRAFDNYFPASGPGTLAYEDLWPGKGDYDFNDLVLDYRFKTVTNSSNKIVETYGTFTIKAFGATLENGFGFQLPNSNINSSDITVTGYDLQEGYITLGSNGLEEGQSNPTIIVYDNAFNIMEHPGTGIGVNTELSAPYVTPETLTIYIDYADNTYTLAQLDIGNFNPFIIIDLERGKEVHLPDYTPTDLADGNYFGTYEDDSNPATGRYYKTENNLPWAINIYESFDYPIEKREISTAYNHFIEWAESGGVSFQDWYQDNSGYRNENNIY